MISGRDFSRGGGPLTWVGTFPVYLATVLAGVQLLTMALTALAMGLAGAMLSGNPVLAPLLFTWQSAVAEGRLWQFVTYAFVNAPGFWTLVQILLLGFFGAEVERFLGRRAFLWLFVALVLAAPLFYAAAGFFTPSGVLVGSSLASFGVFAAFVILYPRAEIFFGLQARWVGLALVAINSLQAFAAGDFVGMVALWWVCGVATTFLRLEGAGFAMPAFPKPQNAPRPKPERKEDLHGSIDPILEKISRSGFASLTADERARLDRARAALIEKEGRGT